MCDNPLVSIALCSYNCQRFIGGQIESILNQSYGNLDIVIVDDCSTDDTVDIINHYAKLDNRIRLYRNEINIGFNKNFEKAISLTRGKYIAISDQDDIWLTDKIERLVENIGSNWMIASNSEFVDYEANLMGKQLLKNFELAGKTYKALLLNNLITGHTTLLSREFLDYCLPIPQNGYYDWWMGFIAIYHNKLAYLDECLTRYRVHTDSVMQKEVKGYNQKASIKRKFQYGVIMAKLESFLNYKNLNEVDYEFISELRNAFHIREQKVLSVPLLAIIYKNYDSLFPHQKKRRYLSRLNFSFKHARGV